MSTDIVTYNVDDGTTVKFEVEVTQGFHPAGSGQVIGQVRAAVGPAVEAAKAVLDKVKEARPSQVEVKFGVKVSGGADWLVARSAAEGSFEITMTWVRDAAEADAAEADAAEADAGAA